MIDIILNLTIDRDDLEGIIAESLRNIFKDLAKSKEYPYDEFNLTGYLINEHIPHYIATSIIENIPEFKSYGA